MKQFLKFLAVFLVLALITISIMAWWLLRWDEIDVPDLPGEVLVGSLLHDGLQRSWLGYLPASAGDQPALLLVMHGSQSSGADMRALSFYGFDVLAERDGFIVIYPEGYQRHWNDCRAGANYVANLQGVDDVGFLRALVQQMVVEHNVDLSRVYATGLSNGGQMAYRLGLEAPELVAGIAAVAANLPVASNFDCSRSGEPVATLVMNGTLDPVNPYEGGVVEILGDTSRGEVLSSRATAAYWASLAEYDAQGEHRAWPQVAPDDGTSVESLSWAQAGKPPVTLITLVGGGHTVPHPLFSLPRILGATSHELDGTEVIWSFFKEAAVASP